MRPSLLQTRDLVFGYPKRKASPIVIGGPVSLDLPRGSLICLLGPNGIGKSTLLRTMAGLQKPLEGEVRLANRPLGGLPPRDLARQRGMLMARDPVPVGMNAAQLVGLGRHPHSGWTARLTAEDEKAVHRAFEEAGATAFRDRMVDELSDGERQRVSIARLLAQEASLLLLDEPTAFLDLPARIELLDRLCILSRKRDLTIVLSTHDLDSALRHADRILLFDSSRQLHSGTPEDLALSGRIGQAFDSSRIRFDVSQARFRQTGSGGRPIRVDGDGTPRFWTRRALERTGWRPVDQIESSPELRVCVTRSGESFRWTIQQPDKPELTAASIEECLAILQPPDSDCTPSNGSPESTNDHGISAS